jgi:hypothetical protein
LQAAGGTIWTEHSPSVTVGEEGQLATKTGGQYEYSTVFGGQQLTAGVHYMEVEVGGEMRALYVGIARPGLDTADGKNYREKGCMDAWFMHAENGTLCGNGKHFDDGAGGFKAGDRIGLLLDLDNDSLLFFKNGEKHGPGYGAGSVTGTMTFNVEVPLGMTAGETMLVLAPNGQHLSVTIPVGVRAGQSFPMEFSPGTPQAYPSAFPLVLAMQMYHEGQSGRVVAGAVRPSGY